MKNEVVIDLGCGRSRHEGAIGVDNAKMPGVDVIADMEEGLPFREGCADSIMMYHVLEHVQDFMGVVSELHRILKPGCRADIRVPYCRCFNAFDPMHKLFFTEHTFDYYFSDDSPFGYYKDKGRREHKTQSPDCVSCNKVRFRVVRKELVLNPMKMNKVLSMFIPKPLLKRLVFDAYNEIHFELEKI
jgi:SAM-dependent methyltransferase